jgi:hypothetical protein
MCASRNGRYGLIPAGIALAIIAQHQMQPAGLQERGPTHHRGRDSLQDLMFECSAFRIVLLEPFVRGNRIGKHLEMIGVTWMVSGVDVNPNGRHWLPADKMPSFAFTRNRERPSAIRRAWARALTAFTVRPRSAAMSMTEALETKSCRSRSSFPEVHALALLFFRFGFSGIMPRFRAEVHQPAAAIRRYALAD